MAGREHLNESLPAPPFHVIDAFLDGESVDPFAFKTALDAPEGREYLVDVLLLRHAVNGDREVWVLPPRRHPATRTRWWTAAAAVVFSAAGFVAGQRTLAAPPRESAVEAFVELPQAPTAPTPTRVISLRPGVNWTDNPGGK